jgi:hypothetical protein
VLIRRTWLDIAMKDAYKGWPLIFFAVRNSRLDIFEYLLECGSSPDVMSPLGVPLLAFIVLCRHNTAPASFVKLALDFGAKKKWIPLGALRDGAQKRDNAPGWMRDHASCASIFVAFSERLTPEIV